MCGGGGGGGEGTYSLGRKSWWRYIFVQWMVLVFVGKRRMSGSGLLEN